NAKPQKSTGDKRRFTRFLAPDGTPFSELIDTTCNSEAEIATVSKHNSSNTTAVHSNVMCSMYT
ncbi:hypothetical protein M9458_031293, partial [Cirrhinus mrigala]